MPDTPVAPKAAPRERYMMSEVAAVLDIDSSTLFDWLRKYRSQGIVAAPDDSDGRVRWLTRDQVQWLADKKGRVIHDEYLYRPGLPAGTRPKAGTSTKALVKRLEEAIAEVQGLKQVLTDKGIVPPAAPPPPMPRPVPPRFADADEIRASGGGPHHARFGEGARPRHSANTVPLPAGWCSMRHFIEVHGLPKNTIREWEIAGRFTYTPAPDGKVYQKADGVTCEKALNLEQQAHMYAVVSLHPRFTPCSACPHAVPLPAIEADQP